ncbi:MAG: branched-chain amino acid ABC transporter permease [Rhodospirillaceae bacterium]|nr:branched-chain amino acid ABC transporter permease [Rhodospirillaceae bacterium]MYF86401.1 branched-chain amino acid ABC transporter permease [Rhodospirillaceae bacterium]MYK15529.1 branched-chain amino acid ABC transporter permease [Rhodospirillaceae bacterium]
MTPVRRFFGPLSPAGLWLGGAFLLLLLLLPFWGGSYVMTVAITVFYLALIGQSWNLMLGFAGLLSIGHALFVGIGAYTAAYLFAAVGLPPVVGIVPAVGLAVLMGLLIGYLGFRFAIGGVYFALLTIAFAEFVRIVIDHVPWLGATEGFFLKVSEADRHGIDLANLRGAPEMYYYLIMALALGALVLCRFLLRSRLGYYWQAIRDDAEAAQALGVNILRYKMYAVAISSGMAGVAGVFYAFYQNSLFPEIVFNIERSIEATLGSIVGGVGTLFGPIFGTFILTPLGEIVTEAIDLLKHWGVIDPQIKLDGLKLLIWGFIVVLIVLFKPKGLWPWVCARLRLTRPGAEG